MDELQTAIELARKAGQIMRDGLSTQTVTEWKDDYTPVTEIDLQINKLVVDTLSQKFPTHSIISEESDNILRESEYAWVCDPVDGTIAFTHGIPTATFSLALVRGGESILGVIYDPFSERLFTARKGQGTFLNNKQVHVSKVTTLKNQIVGLPLWGDERNLDLEIIDKLKKKKVFNYNTCGIIYLGTLVVQGSLAGALYLGRFAHDAAALKVIIEEAGGRATDMSGREQRYDQAVNGCVMSNGLVHDELIELTKNNLALK